jgi:6-phosphofructokinase
VKPLKRINIRYGGDHYTLARTDMEELKNEIATAIENGGTHWLHVNRGEGSFQQADLLITTGTPIAIIGIEIPPED